MTTAELQRLQAHHNFHSMARAKLSESQIAAQCPFCQGEDE